MSGFRPLRFMTVHVDPIAADERFKSNLKRAGQIYDLLEYTGKKDDGINLIGNYAPIDTESEFFRVLSGWGINRVRQRFSMKTFAEFLQMADSRLTLVLSHAGGYAAQAMAERLDIPYLASQINYEIEAILKAYQEMALRIGRSSA